MAQNMLDGVVVIVTGEGGNGGDNDAMSIDVNDIISSTYIFMGEGRFRPPKVVRPETKGWRFPTTRLCPTPQLVEAMTRDIIAPAE